MPSSSQGGYRLSTSICLEAGAAHFAQSYYLIVKPAIFRAVKDCGGNTLYS
ncbi:MAG: hypothetical protein SFY66_03575 [Oculatellaceae cyanobacterium bins.114]|nr:hypothetical protein [Oculatellaceae cyanobacterium bins.114]